MMDGLRATFSSLLKQDEVVILPPFPHTVEVDHEFGNWDIEEILVSAVKENLLC
jgi:hypothetical protein